MVDYKGHTSEIERRVALSKTILSFKEKKVFEILKRFLDIFLSFIGIILILWLLLIIAICIKLQDGGSVFYNHIRIGKNGKPFKMYKFRTMVPGADKLKKELIQKNETSGKTFKMKNDPRITKIGRFLRKTSLDELPQLFNVFNGTMSFVGPRPALPEEVMEYKNDDEFFRLSVKQGLTCIWQVSGRSTTTFQQQIEMDKKYVFKRSPLLDFLILFRTVPAVLFQKGAE